MESEEGGPRITAEFLKVLLKSKKSYYQTQSLNDTLYLHFKGLRKIENLDGFTGLKTLYIESNEIAELEGFERLLQLSALYAQENCIARIEGLNPLKALRVLNLSSNRIRQIEGLEGLVSLENLQLARNLIGKEGTDDVIGVLAANGIKTLDLAKNFIDEPKIVKEVLVKLPKLRVLYLQGNKVVGEIESYRKTMISTLRNLKHLDDAPVFDEDRRYADAFIKGGLKEERLERDKAKKEKEELERKYNEEFRMLVGEVKTSLKEVKHSEEHIGDIPELEPYSSK
eukprot:TRINITY_DN3044_c0_g1_i1.p1 TRINITY_DN3044_c0_g1~~TRINITY_DN3044_c0_g1_i1.p1  ORF type:complete len:284 (+),score=70.14 TRINITY_DN3044_c0_g1_i1:54-905(+)